MRAARARAASRHPFNVAALNTVATITNAVAVPSSKATLRNTMPIATVATHTMTPVLADSGSQIGRAHV